VLGHPAPSLSRLTSTQPAGGQVNAGGKQTRP
jgi:hypothetical protein